jgi:N-methylhydantoinase A
VHGGVLSALGMLLARPGRQLSRSLVHRLSPTLSSTVEAGLGELADQGIAELVEEGFVAADILATPSVDLRYLGQSNTLNLPWAGFEATSASFHALHEQRYGHRLPLAIELVNLRQSVQAPATDIELPRRPVSPPATPHAWCQVGDGDSPVARYRREDLAVGQRIAGPALVEERVATTWLAPGWSLRVDAVGNLVLDFAADAAGPG